MELTDKEKSLLEKLKKASKKDIKFSLTLTIDDEILQRLIVDFGDIIAERITRSGREIMSQLTTTMNPNQNNTDGI
jgi:hypothetical protein